MRRKQAEQEALAAAVAEKLAAPPECDCAALKQTITELIGATELPTNYVRLGIAVNRPRTVLGQ